MISVLKKSLPRDFGVEKVPVRAVSYCPSCVAIRKGPYNISKEQQKSFLVNSRNRSTYNFNVPMGVISAPISTILVLLDTAVYSC